MEKKRKMPARAAARVDHISKRRNMTPEKRSITPAPAPVSEPETVPVEEPPPPLPKSIQPGKPLPTVEGAQPEDLSSKDYQSIAESGVLAESLQRSRQRWISEGIFERYWTKPSKRKGVVVENNPPKESMTKVGQVTITVEPHVFEATMFIVKDPKQPAPVPAVLTRPILQYGPPNGVMPPPSTPIQRAETPVVANALPSPVAAPLQSPLIPKGSGTQTPTPVAQAPRLTQPGHQSPVVASPQPQVQPPAQLPLPAQPQVSAPVPAVAPPAGAPPFVPITPAAAGSPVATPPLVAQKPPPLQVQPPVQPAIQGPSPSTPASQSVKPPGAPAPVAKGPAPGTDPIILTLAEKAGEDPQLRELMRKVAQGDAAKHELERFQAIIDQITAESKRKGAAQGPSADRLLVDGKTVRYFADEVRAILDIVLLSNPRQTSADLRPPAGSDPLVVQLVKAALDEPKTREMVRRIAENKPQFSDATDLKAVLDRLKTKLAKEQRQAQLPTSGTPRLGHANGRALSSELQSPHAQQPQQALRSKGPPPPPPKPDISAVVFEFAGGNGDRYSFPKFCILENVPLATGQQVIASFLIVRKGSASEYPAADPELDYYQPVTLRLYAPTGRHLEHLFRIVAPEDEVRRYMDDIMDKMTRAEYVLLAMRLPRAEPAIEQASSSDMDVDKDVDKDVVMTGVTPSEIRLVNKPVQPTVQWTTKAPKPEIRELPPRIKVVHSKAMDADEQYRSFITAVSRKEVQEA